jgi:hypothetical protein
VAEAGLVTLSVVEHLDVLEQVGAGLVACVERDAAPDVVDLALDGAPHGLHRGVVQRVGLPPVRVQFNGEMTTPKVRSRPKPIPVSGQYCSDYGMYGEVG